LNQIGFGGPSLIVVALTVPHRDHRTGDPEIEEIRPGSPENPEL